MRTLLCVWIVCTVAGFAWAGGLGKVTVTAEQAPLMQGKETVLTAKKGDTFDVSGVKGDWFGVLPSRGWIHKGNVKYEAPSPNPVSPDAHTSQGKGGENVGTVSPKIPQDGHWQSTKQDSIGVSFDVTNGGKTIKNLSLQIEYGLPGQSTKGTIGFPDGCEVANGGFGLDVGDTSVFGSFATATEASGKAKITMMRKENEQPYYGASFTRMIDVPAGTITRQWVARRVSDCTIPSKSSDTPAKPAGGSTAPLPALPTRPK